MIKYMQISNINIFFVFKDECSIDIYTPMYNIISYIYIYTYYCNCQPAAIIIEHKQRWHLLVRRGTLWHQAWCSVESNAGSPCQTQWRPARSSQLGCSCQWGRQAFHLTLLPSLPLKVATKLLRCACCYLEPKQETSNSVKRNRRNISWHMSSG